MASMADNRGKQVMLSYNHNSKHIMKKVFDILKDKNISAWFDERDVKENIYDRYRFQPENAFLNELQYTFLRRLV